MSYKFAKQVTVNTPVIHYGEPLTVTRITRNYKTDKITLYFDNGTSITVSPDYLVEMGK